MCEAADDAEVIDLVHWHQLEVVLMDIRIPRVDGLEAIGLIRARSIGGCFGSVIITG